MASLSEVLTLKINGSQVSYRKIGKGRRKILFFHGFPGSSAQAEFFSKYADELDFEVISIDRPGYNQSEATGPQFAQSNRFLTGLLDHHGWNACELIAVSGGTPFLFSFAQNHPQRISKITIVSGLGPVGNREFRHFLSPKMHLALKIFPFVPRALISSRSVARLVSYLKPVSLADQNAMMDFSSQEVLNTSLQEAFAQNGLGPQKDARTYRMPWSLDLSSFQGPIEIWHGEEDLVLPVQMSKQIHAALPQAKLNIVSGEGHYSLSMNHIRKILQP